MRALALVLLVSCGPKLAPCPPTTPPIVVTPDPTPCTLPDLPAPLDLGAHACGDGTICVSRSGWDALGVYLADLRTWIQVAASCLEVP